MLTAACSTGKILRYIYKAVHASICSVNGGMQRTDLLCCSAA
jgi:hypothetical protein